MTSNLSFLQIPYMILALVDNKVSAEGRKDLLEWLSRKLSGINDSSDAIQLLKPACSALAVPILQTIWLEFLGILCLAFLILME